MIIGGRYVIEEPIASGGMGRVDLAYDPVLNRRVAIKRCRDGLPARLGGDRLRREARLAARVDHRAVVPVFDLVDDPAGPALVMAYVMGPSLQELHELGPVRPAGAVRLARELAGALAAIHEHDIVHLDLKLENVVLAPDGQPVVLDFGISRDGDGDDEDDSDGFIEGTPRVMSPEQISGHEVDARSDLFSFGVLLYELLAGETPFGGGPPERIIARALTHQPPALASLGLGIPAALSDLVEHLLEKEPSARPQSAAEVAVRLRAW